MSDVSLLEAPAPKAANWLGYSGLIPFVALTIALLFGQGDLLQTARLALLGYGVAILSFMGGVHWGRAMAQPANGKSASLAVDYAISVVPALAAWSVFALPPSVQFIWLAGCFGVLGMYDVLSARSLDFPAWYPGLRLRLTLVVVTCLLLAAGAGLVH
ncbi:MAG: DUF3429 domain-containing protein [Pseudomonadota bacterium]